MVYFLSFKPLAIKNALQFISLSGFKLLVPLLVPSELLETTLEILYELLLNDTNIYCDKKMSGKIPLYLERLESSFFQEKIQAYFKVKPKEKNTKTEIASLRPPLMKALSEQLKNLKVYEKVVVVNPVITVAPRLPKPKPPIKESFEALANIIELPRAEKIEARVEEVKQIKEMLVGSEVEDIPIDTITTVIEYLLNAFDDTDHVGLVSASALSVLAQSPRNREIMMEFDGIKKLLDLLHKRFDLELIEQVLSCLHQFAKKGISISIIISSRIL